MTITTLSSRQFSQDASGARKAAQNGPVFITDRGRPAHVLLTIEQYQQLIGQQANIVDLLAIQDKMMPNLMRLRSKAPCTSQPVSADVVAGCQR